MPAGRETAARLRRMSPLADSPPEPLGHMLNQLLALPPQPGDLRLKPIDKPGMVGAARRRVAMAQLADPVAQRLQFPPFEGKHHDLP